MNDNFKFIVALHAYNSFINGMNDCNHQLLLIITLSELLFIEACIETTSQSKGTGMGLGGLGDNPSHSLVVCS